VRKSTKVWVVLFLIALTSSFAAALERPASVQPPAAGQSISGSQDVITASDAGGGDLSNRDILLIVLIVLAIFGLAAIL